MRARKILFIPIVILGVSLLLYLSLWFVLYGQLRAEGRSSALEDYPRALARMDYPATRFFPAEIPEDAQEIAFYYEPGAFQGGSAISLRYTATEDKVAALLRSLPRQSAWSGTLRENDSQKTGIFDTNLNLLQDKKAALPSDLTLYLIHSKPHRPGDWNHGALGFVALSQSLCTVLFYDARW